MYSNSSRSANLAGGAAAEPSLTVENFKKWARDLDLDGKQFDTCFDSGKYADEITKDIADGTASGITGTPGFFVNDTAISGAQPYASFKNAIEAALSGKGDKNAAAPASADDDPFIGNANAPVTMIEFSDYQCPFCLRFWSETLPQIKKDYIDTGKVKFVYRDFPLNIHPMAEPSARAANCAGEQGKYWEYHDKIFSEQS